MRDIENYANIKDKKEDDLLMCFEEIDWTEFSKEK